MKREEAIKWFIRMKESPFVPLPQGAKEAIDMAIEALEMQNNCIICPRCGREFSEYEGRKQTNDK